ncbi:MAG TPA: TetR/AcrR family transcriptional regulator [Burkholderiales bacterium]|nr:TetR/AcrR family transcriptional regulator [Burkholderiales bacterium]
MFTVSTYHHGDLRPALLRAAARVLEKEGPAALSLRSLARRAGVSHNAPYRHFADREALLAALAAEGYRMLGEALAGASGRAIGEAYLRFALAHPQRFRLMFGGHLPMARHRELAAAAARPHQALVDAFRAEPSIGDAEQAAAAAWSLVHGLAHLLLDGHFPGAAADRDAFVRGVIGAVRFAARAG